MSVEKRLSRNPAPSIRNPEDELAEVYSRQRPLLIGIARKRGIIRDAEDVVQDSAIQALLKIRSGDYEERGKLAAYLGVIARNRAISVGRKTLNSVPLADFSESFVSTKIEENHPEKAAMNREELAAVRVAVGQLSPRQRDVLVLWSQGLTHEEICRELDIKVINSKVSLSKARKRLKSLL